MFEISEIKKSITIPAFIVLEESKGKQEFNIEEKCEGKFYK